jgi:hypothetical protein
VLVNLVISSRSLWHPYLLVCISYTDYTLLHIPRATIRREAPIALKIQYQVRPDQFKTSSMDCNLTILHGWASITDGVCEDYVETWRGASQHSEAVITSFVYSPVDQRATKGRSENQRAHWLDFTNSEVSRHLRLQLGLCMTGVYQLRTKQSRCARCSWCNNSEWTATYLLTKCRTWRGERDAILINVQLAQGDQEWYIASSREPSEWYPTRLVSLSFATAQISELVGRVAIGSVA